MREYIYAHIAHKYHTHGGRLISRLCLLDHVIYARLRVCLCVSGVALDAMAFRCVTCGVRVMLRALVFRCFCNR